MIRGFLPALLLAFCQGCSNGVDLVGDAVDGDAAVDDGADPGDAGETPADVADDSPGETADATDSGDGDVAAGCEPQDARASGPCAAEVPGVAWNGTHCVPLGSGCECAGTDCGSVYDSVEACVEARRACYSASCEPRHVADSRCVDCDAVMFLGAFWDGRECFDLWGCECTGDGCSGAFASVEECAAVQAACDGALCAATGGEWVTREAGLCGFECGVPADRDCFTPIDSCNCGPGRTFEYGVGCAADICDASLLCRATSGTWHPASECYCGFGCGHPGDCAACLDSCDCGPHGNFDPARGCVPDTGCDGTDRAAVCTSTGGTWHECGPGGDCSCGDYYCGFPNLTDPCVMPGCDCGPYSNFDTTLGCVYDEGCFRRTEGQSCRGMGRDSTCRAGLVCCEGCGVPPGCPSCAPPCCPGPGCGEDGCFPPPP